MKYGIRLAGQTRLAPSEIFDEQTDAQRYLARYCTGDDSIEPLHEVSVSITFLVPNSVSYDKITTAIANAEVQVLEAEGFSDDGSIEPFPTYSVVTVSAIDGKVV